MPSLLIIVIVMLSSEGHSHNINVIGELGQLPTSHFSGVYVCVEGGHIYFPPLNPTNFV